MEARQCVPEQSKTTSCHLLPAIDPGTSLGGRKETQTPQTLLTPLECFTIDDKSKAFYVRCYRKTFTEEGQYISQNQQQDFFNNGRLLCWYILPPRRYSLIRRVSLAFPVLLSNF